MDQDTKPTDLNPAIAQLMLSAENCETNAPIHEAEGNLEQAELSRANARSYRAAIAVLQGQSPQGSLL